MPSAMFRLRLPLSRHEHSDSLGCQEQPRAQAFSTGSFGPRLGTVAELHNEEGAWMRVDELGLKPYAPDAPKNPWITFGEVAAHYAKIELPEDQSTVTIEKSQSTITKYARCGLAKPSQCKNGFQAELPPFGPLPAVARLSSEKNCERC
jgi:hypothetical protein